MRCFFCQDIPANGETAFLDERESNHAFRIIRCREGDNVLLLDGKGCLAQSKVSNDGFLGVERTQLSEPGLKLALFVSPPRRQIMDDMLRHLSELGCWSISPIVTERSVSVPEGNSALNRWKTILIEGCKQSHNPFLPEISVPATLDAAIATAKRLDSLFFCDSGGDNSNPFNNLPIPLNVGVFIGPEGGFSDVEKLKLKEAGAIPLWLGPWTMRTETASIAAIAILGRFYAMQDGGR